MSTKPGKDRGYPWIVAWGKMLGSHASYIYEQCDQAAADKAPSNAIYKNNDGGWETTDGITSQSTRFSLGLPALPLTHEKLLAEYDAEIISKEPAAGVDNFRWRIRFPSVERAVAWVRNVNSVDTTIVFDHARASLGFGEPVVIEYLPSQLCRSQNAHDRVQGRWCATVDERPDRADHAGLGRDAGSVPGGAGRARR